MDAAVAAAAANKSQLTKQKNMIMAEVKPSPFMADAAWKADQERRCAELAKRFEGVGDAMAEELGGPHGPLLKQLTDIELPVLLALHAKARDPSTSGAGIKQYGMPFDQDNKHRRLFWPSLQTECPLFYICACILLVGAGASTSTERAHSTLGRILSKLRCSMTGGNLERNMMAYTVLRKQAAQLASGAVLKEMHAAHGDLFDFDEAADAILEHEEIYPDVVSPGESDVE